MKAASIALVKKVVAEEFGVTEIDLCSARRAREIARPRQVAYWLCKTLTVRSLPEIGRAFGNRDHTTVMQGVRAAERYMAADLTLQVKAVHARDRIAQFADQEVA